MITVENDFMKFWIEDGILHSQFKKSVIINIEKIKALIELRTQISNGEKQYWCYNFDGNRSGLNLKVFGKLNNYERKLH